MDASNARVVPGLAVRRLRRSKRWCPRRPDGPRYKAIGNNRKLSQWCAGSDGALSGATGENRMNTERFISPFCGRGLSPPRRPGRVSFRENAQPDAGHRWPAGRRAGPGEQLKQGYCTPALAALDQAARLQEAHPCAAEPEPRRVGRPAAERRPARSAGDSPGACPFEDARSPHTAETDHRPLRLGCGVRQNQNHPDDPPCH
ncbi:hypothetical protein ACPA9J_00135 [Pseudomonas aeruginosa]